MQAKIHACSHGSVSYIVAPSNLATIEKTLELVRLMIEQLFLHRPCKIILDVHRVETRLPGLTSVLVAFAKLTEDSGTMFRIFGADSDWEERIRSRAPKLVPPFATIGEGHATPPA